MYGVQSELLLASMRDRALVNNLAMQTVNVVYPLLMDIGCYSHTCGREFQDSEAYRFHAFVDHSLQPYKAAEEDTGMAQHALLQ